MRHRHSQPPARQSHGRLPADRIRLTRRAPKHLPLSLADQGMERGDPLIGASDGRRP